jgi:hypothetical protein
MTLPRYEAHHPLDMNSTPWKGHIALLEYVTEPSLNMSHNRTWVLFATVPNLRINSWVSRFIFNMRRN